jgi:hypothetical protein
MRTLLLVSAVALLASGCSNAPSAASRTPPASPPPGATIVPGGCASTVVLQGGAPSWTHQLEIPYVLATPPVVAGFIFGYPLRAGHPTNPANKILWQVNALPYGPSLDITAHLVGSNAAAVTQSVGFLDNGDLPSIVDMPQPGCWHMDLSWSGHHAAMELQYQ